MRYESQKPPGFNPTIPPPNLTFQRERFNRKKLPMYLLAFFAFGALAYLLWNAR